MCQNTYMTVPKSNPAYRIIEIGYLFITRLQLKQDPPRKKRYVTTSKIIILLLQTKCRLRVQLKLTVI